MTVLPLLMRHEGKHRRQYEPGPLALVFRRLVRPLWRKPAVPVALDTAGAAAALLTPAGEHPYPWPPVPRPGFPVPTEEWRLDDTRYDLPVARPYAPLNSDEETRELYHGGDQGTRPQAEVREAGRLAGVMQP